MQYECMGAEVFSGLDEGKVGNPKLIIDSLGSESKPLKTMSTNSKSGEYFFLSGDRRFIVKTITEAEAQLLFRMLPAYKDHLAALPASMIVRYAGLYAVQVAGFGVMYFSVMASVFDPQQPPWQTFDIKGSMHGRKKKEKESIGKDWDWVKGSFNLQISDEFRRKFCATHEQDVAFLANFDCMDYSLLIGFHKLSGEENGEYSNRYGIGGGLKSTDSTMIYYVGLIDFLIAYRLKKQAETVLRTAQGVGDIASCVDPLSYAIRQVRFVRDQVVAGPAAADEEGVWGTQGLLKVQVVAGHDLINADLKTHGLSDPYVKVMLGLQERKTRTIKDSLNPKWDEMVYLCVDEAHLTCSLQISVWDEDKGVVQGADDFLGQYLIPMEQVVASGPTERRVTLQNVPKGELSFILDYKYSPERRKQVAYL